MATTKKTKFILPIALLAGGILYYWKNLKGFITTSTVTLSKVVFNKPETNKTLYTKLILDLIFEIKNPAAFQGTLKGVKLDLLVNNNNLGSVTNTNTQVIMANGTTMVTVQAGINSLQLLGNIANVVLYPESGMTWLGVALSWGFNLMFGIYLASFNSQAHLNPCVSLCFYLFDKSITLTQLVIHSVAQLVGAFLAASVVYGIYYDKISLLKDDKTASSIFATYKANDVHTGCAFFTEFLGTGLLVSGIFAILTNSKTKITDNSCIKYKIELNETKIY
jgi:glycerol uptake facilitator-like aquaporin